MATIQSTVKIFDGYSPIIKNMIKVNQNIISSFGSTEQASGKAFNLNAISDAQNALAQVETDFDDVERQIKEAAEQQKKFTQDIRNGDTASKSLLSTFGKMAATVGAGTGVKKVFDISDQMTSTKARLNLLIDDNGSVAELESKIFASAQRSRAAYMDTASAVSKLGLNAGNAFNHDNDQIVAFMEQVNKQFVIGGATAQEQSNAMIQLTQAMAAGALRGEELNSILDGAPGIARAIEQYMGIAEGSIKKYAAEGLITASVVKNALFDAADETNAKFEAMPKTWAQIWTMAKNEILMGFAPVLQKLNDMINSPKFSQGIRGIINAFIGLAGVALTIFETIGNAAAWVGDNWGGIAPIIMGVVGAYIAYNAVALITNGILAAQAIVGKIKAAADMMQAGSTFVATAAQHGLNAALWACPITWIIVAIIALIAIFYAVVGAINHFAGTSVSATGIIIGAFAVLGAVIWNTVVGVIDAVIQFLWTNFVEPWIGVIEFVLNVFNGGFNSFGDAVKNLLGNIISWFLSLGKVVTKIIDAIFGTNWTAGLSSLQDDVLAWGKNENAITLSREAPSLQDLGVGRIEYGKAWNAGYGLGEGIEDSIGGAFNFDDSAYDAGFDWDGLMNGVDDIAGNTAKGAESLEFAEEDVKYMRDIAERDAINRYTTAEIHIEQNNENHISSNMDLDGVVGYLNDGVEEAVDIATEGGHE